MKNKKKRLMAYLEETACFLMRETDEASETDWPHQSDQRMIRLQEQILECEWELKQLENQMACAEHASVRRYGAKRRQLLERLRRLNSARFAAASWEEYFLMFREDETLRRSCWMDVEFYEKERADICRKLEPCSEYCRPVEEKVFSLLDEKCNEQFRDEIYWYAIGCMFLEQYSQNPLKLFRG